MARLRADRRRWWHVRAPRLNWGLRAALLAAAISAAKVALFVVGSAAFLAEHPAHELAWVYLALAGIAAGAALALTPLLEQTRPVTAMAVLLAVAAALVAFAGLALAAALPWAPLAVLMLAHLYNIASEIVLWLVAAAWLPPPELRRATAWIFLATALGGFVGGIAVERLLVLGLPTALVLVSLAALLHAGLWLAWSARAARVRDEGDAELATLPAHGPNPTGWGVLLAHPLGLPLGAASFLLTFVWVLTEYLCFARYQSLRLDPDALSRFLAAVLAILQLVEFAAIALLAAPATRWVSPVWRSALFPSGALLTLLWMGRDPTGLPATLVAHAYTEAASNALFDPVHASNFAAVPRRLQARLRAVSEGVCYPLGMASGGLALLIIPSSGDGTPGLGVLELAMAAALLFVAVGGFTGIMIAPSLLTALGLTSEVGASPERSALRAARRALGPSIRRTRCRNRLLTARTAGAAHLARQVDVADRRALRAAFAAARRCDRGGAVRQLEILLDSRSLETRALVVEALLSLPVRRLFLPFLPALRRRYAA